MGKPTELAKLDELKRQIDVITRASGEIMACSDIGEVRQFIDMTEALKAIAKRIRAGVHHHNAIVSANLWARRRLGQLLGPANDFGGNPNGVGVPSHDGTVHLRSADTGISRREVHRARAVAAVTDARYAWLVQATIDKGDELTTKLLVDEGIKHLRKEKKKEMLLAGAGRMSELDVHSDWQIHRGDCLEVFHLIESGSVRLVFADPPYNIGIDYGDHYDDSRPDDEFAEWCADWIAECYRVLSEDGSLWILINHEWYAHIREIAEYKGFRWNQTITWFESFGVNCPHGFNRCSRPLIWFVKDRDDYVFNDEAPEIRRASDRQAKYDDPRANPLGKLWDDVWGINPPIPRLVGNASERMPDFPTQVPLALLRPIVACASDRGDTILDPFCGSGTTGAACIELARKFIGIELSEEFAELARMRLINKEKERSDGRDHVAR